MRIARPISEIEDEFVNGIMEAIKNNSDIESDENDEILFHKVDAVGTYKDWSVATRDKGVAVLLTDNTEIYITVQVKREHW